MSLNNVEAKVLLGQKRTEKFNINKRVKQGDGQSTNLFNLAIHSVIEQIEHRDNFIYNSKQICSYAYDITLLTRTREGLKELFTAIELEGRKLGLMINEAKTNYMCITLFGRRADKS